MSNKSIKTAHAAAATLTLQLCHNVAMAARNEASSMASVALAIQAACKGRKLGIAKADGSKGAAPFYLAMQAGYYAGCLSTMLPRFGNMPETGAIEAAYAVIADKKRGKAENTALAACRQRWNRALARAGIASPIAKTPEQTEKAKTSRAKGNATNAGQGKAAEPTESAIVSEAKKLAPPSEYNRETDVAWLRETIARMIVRIERFNQHSSKTKSNGMPVNIIGDLMDLQDRAKKWVF